jgi:hypothetical protein
MPANPFKLLILVGVLILLILSAGQSRTDAQLPFYTDDADTTEKGKFHLEIFDEHDLLQVADYPAKRQNNINSTINYGLTSRLEIDLNAPLLHITYSQASGIPNPSGFGDTQLGLMYRFHDEKPTSALPAMAVAFYVEYPTGNELKQLGSGVVDYYLYGVAQKSLTEKTVGRLNGGIVFAGNTSTGLVGIETTRGHVYTGNGSLVRSFTPRLSLGAELFGALTGNFKLSRGQLTGQIGGTYSLTNQLTLAFGIIGGKFAASPRLGAIVGIAYDFK